MHCDNIQLPLSQVLLEKWSHIMPLSPAFKSEVRRWVNYWKRQLPVPKISVTQILASHADATFYPNVRELLQVLCVLRIGSVEAERSFSCVRRVHN